MAQLIVRKIEDEVVKELKQRAGQHGHSAEEEHRAILRKVLLGSGQSAAGMSFEEYLGSMPDVGDDADFSRIEGSIRDVDLTD